MGKMNIACIGAGSIGMLVTAKLAAAGADVLLIAHTDEQASLLAGAGLTLVERDAEKTMQVRAISFERLKAPGERAGAGIEKNGPFDWVLLTVKQKHIADSLLEPASRLLGDSGRLLCFQNGVGHVEAIERHVPRERLYLAVTTEGAKKLAPNRVAHTGSGITWIGPAQSGDRGQMSPPAEQKAQNLLQNALCEAGFRASLSNQMEEIVWNKLLINSVVNPLTALLRVRNGELPVGEHRIGLMRTLLDEGIAVATGAGIPTRDDLWEQLIDVCAKTADNASSMLQDLSDGRSTEIDWITGAIVRTGRRLRIPAPMHETIYRLVKAAEPAAGRDGRQERTYRGS
ncbi:ketopantoate reductase family protein [Paenibacillus sp. GYB003]|uniref:ketopantoate reductase family protein n=1 Tax=Paenibacillus sp. GYB003 TaxID=2994392 RepID=UPI002F969125